MRAELKAVTRELAFRAPASNEELESVISKLRIQVPEDYLEFMRETNGAEGTIGDSYLQIWPVEQLPELNEAYSVQEFAPGLVLFGSDGGDVGYGFLAESAELLLVEVPFIGMSLEEVVPRGSTFLEFISSLASR